jgi:hypothetical protein
MDHIQAHMKVTGNVFNSLSTVRCFGAIMLVKRVTWFLTTCGMLARTSRSTG